MGLRLTIHKTLAERVHCVGLALVPGSLPHTCAIFTYDLWTPSVGGEAGNKASVGFVALFPEYIV